MTVCIGQADVNKSHNHTFTGNKQSGTAAYIWAAGELATGILSKDKTSIAGVSGTGDAGANYNVSISFTPSGTISTVGGKEARPVNVTVKLWKRTA